MEFDDVTCCAQLADFTLPEKIIINRGNKKSSSKDDIFKLTTGSSEFGGKEYYFMCYQNKDGINTFYNVGTSKLGVLNKTKMQVMKYMEREKRKQMK